jgi:hypothetical protein
MKTTRKYPDVVRTLQSKMGGKKRMTPELLGSLPAFTTLHCTCASAHLTAGKQSYKYEFLNHNFQLVA